MMLEPVDPKSLSTDELKERCLIIMSQLVTPPDAPLPAGWFRCYLCWRDFEASRSPEEAMEASKKRFGYSIPLERMIILCDDCNVVVSTDLGIPL